MHKPREFYHLISNSGKLLYTYADIVDFSNFCNNYCTHNAVSFIFHYFSVLLHSELPRSNIEKKLHSLFLCVSFIFYFSSLEVEVCYTGNSRNHENFQEANNSLNRKQKLTKVNSSFDLVSLFVLFLEQYAKQTPLHEGNV